MIAQLYQWGQGNEDMESGSWGPLPGTANWVWGRKHQQRTFLETGQEPGHGRPITKSTCLLDTCSVPGIIQRALHNQTHFILTKAMYK